MEQSFHPLTHSRHSKVLLKEGNGFVPVPFNAARGPPTDEVVACGVVPKFVELLQRTDDPKLQVRCVGLGSLITSIP
jgi:hypothetical protein